VGAKGKASAAFRVAEGGKTLNNSFLLAIFYPSHWASSAEADLGIGQGAGQTIAIAAHTRLHHIKGSLGIKVQPTGVIQTAGDYFKVRIGSGADWGNQPEQTAYYNQGPH
jgi:hypothetical protein